MKCDCQHDPACLACGGSGISHCCEGEQVDMTREDIQWVNLQSWGNAINVEMRPNQNVVGFVRLVT